MSEFRGILLISGSQSSVNGDILLMAGDQDSDQAMSGATSFVKRKGFQSGFSIVVTGSLGQVGTVSGILMTNAAAPAVAVPAAMVETAARTSTAAAATPRKKAVSNKKKATARKKKSGAKKARTQTAKRKKQKKSKRSR